jgi:Radical SAM superfamily
LISSTTCSPSIENASSLFCQTLLGSGDQFYWGCSARTDCIDDDLIALMARAGCRGIFFGIETGSPRLQKIIDKGLDLHESAERIQTCDRSKIKTAMSLITGFPEETRQDLRDTVAFFMDSLRFDHADPQLCILAPLGGTPIERTYRDQLIFDDVISDMSFQGWHQDAADREMIARHREISSNFYSVPTPHVDRHLLKELRKFLLNGMTVFRWLPIGLHQDAGNLLDVFEQWRIWRARAKPPFPEDNATLYYGQPSFHCDFLQFARSEWLPNCRAPIAIKALIDYEPPHRDDTCRQRPRDPNRLGTHPAPHHA